MNITTYDLSRSCHRYHQGFTLVELMVTMSILAIVVGIAAPNISTQLANQRVKSTAATVESILREAKAESIIRRNDISFSYDENSNPKMVVLRGDDGVVISTYSYDVKSIIKGTVPTVFRPNKSVDASAVYTVCDSNPNVAPRQISINSLANISNKQGGNC